MRNGRRQRRSFKLSNAPNLLVGVVSRGFYLLHVYTSTRTYMSTGLSLHNDVYYGWARGLIIRATVYDVWSHRAYIRPVLTCTK